MSTSPPSSPPPSPFPSGSGDLLLDLRGEVCPYTFVRARLALEAMAAGAALVIAVDHPPAVRNLPRSLRDWGQEVTAVVEAGPAPWWIRVVKRVA
ncbi:MAG: sulfurtransferase TusA family protein [Myxococcales bacterium]|nr:sulfurtransferase TusA family protein [Myxococcales bacterium]